LHRKEGTRELRKILIVCEGEKTEPNYFKAFPDDPYVIDVKGDGRNTVSLVEEAIQLKNEAERKRVPYQEVWCVFDRDSFPLKNYNEAIALADREKIRCAYSNEAFEIWYLLHFDYHDAGLSRTQYKDKLTEKLGTKYLKNDETMYYTLQDKQEIAIRNARKLYSFQCEQASQRKQAIQEQNPVTLVFKLVEKLGGLDLVSSFNGFAITGKDLIEIKIQPGKRIWSILNKLQEIVASDSTQNNRELLLEIARDINQRYGDEE
jgi:hypothetical protein